MFFFACSISYFMTFNAKFSLCNNWNWRFLWFWIKIDILIIFLEKFWIDKTHIISTPRCEIHSTDPSTFKINSWNVMVKRGPKTSGSSTPLRDFPLREGPSDPPSIDAPSTTFHVFAWPGPIASKTCFKAFYFRSSNVRLSFTSNFIINLFNLQ